MSNAKTGSFAFDPLAELMSATKLMSADFPKPCYVIQELIPTGLTLLVGASKMKKSWWMLDTAVNVATEQGDVLYLALEDTPRRLQDRLTKLYPGGQVPERLEIACQGRWPRLDAGGLAALEAWLKAHPDARLIIVDTLAKVRPPSKRNGNTYQEDYEVMSGLKHLADRYSVAIIVVHHLRKQCDPDDPFNQISGTTGLMGCADTAMVLQGRRNSNDAQLHVTGRDVEERTISMNWDPDQFRWTLNSGVCEAEDENVLSAVRKAMLDLLRLHGPMTMRQIVEVTGEPEGTIKSRLSRMVGNGQLVNQNGAYSLPDTRATDAHAEI